MSTGAKVVAWRYRVGGDGRFEPGPWKLVHEEAECNFHPQYEREPLVLQSDHLAEVRAAKDEGRRWRKGGRPSIDRRGHERPLVLVIDQDGWMGIAQVFADGRWVRRGKRARYAPEFWMPLPAPPTGNGENGR